MHVVVDIPEPKSNGLDSALAKQFADIQRQLMGLMKEKDASNNQLHERLMEAMEEQQQTLVSSLERLLGMVSKQFASQPSDALVTALRGLRQVVSELPGDLKNSLDRQYQSVQERTMKVSVNPQVTVEMPKGLVNRLDSLETALLNGLHRSRNRTFGSNF